MNIVHNDALIDKLAAEYVLGTLKGGARRRFETWMRDSAVMRRAVAEWQDRLHPMAELAAPARPSPQVWQSISRRLDLQPWSWESRRSFWLELREDLSFWRGLGMFSTALASVLLTVLLAQQPQKEAPAMSYVAMLADDKSQPVALVMGDARQHKLMVKVMHPPQMEADKSMQLWAVPKEGPPRSLGLLVPNDTMSLPMPENVTPESVPVLAISLEPKGGSPDPKGPTGPIMFKGAWLQI